MNGFFQVENSDVDERMSVVGVSAWAVFCVLRRHRRHATGIATVARETIRAATGLSPRAISDCIGILAREGMIRIVGRKGDTGQYALGAIGGATTAPPFTLEKVRAVESSALVAPPSVVATVAVGASRANIDKNPYEQGQNLPYQAAPEPFPSGQAGQILPPSNTERVFLENSTSLTHTPTVAHARDDRVSVSGEVVGVNGYHSSAWDRCEPSYRDEIDRFFPSEGVVKHILDRGLPVDELVSALKSYREHRYLGARQEISDLNYRNFVVTWFMPKALGMQPVQVRAKEPEAGAWRPPEQRRASGRSR